MNPIEPYILSSELGRQLTTSEEICAAQRLRYDVWQSEGVTMHDLARGVIADHHDDHAMHWGVFAGDQLVAAARLCLHDRLSDAPDAEMFSSISIPAPIASLNRLIVHKSYRGRGLSDVLDRVRVQRANELHARAVIAAPVNVASRKESLRAQGFQFLPQVTGDAKWSPDVKISACYLLLNPPGAAIHD